MNDNSQSSESNRPALDPRSRTNWWLVFLFTATTGPLCGLSVGLGPTWAAWIDAQFATGEKWSQILAAGLSAVLGMALIILVLKAFHISLDQQPDIGSETPRSSVPSDAATDEEAELIQRLEELIDDMKRERRTALHWSYVVAAMLTMGLVGKTVGQAFDVGTPHGFFVIAMIGLVIFGERALGDLLRHFGRRRLPA